MLRPSYTDLLEVIAQKTDDITLASRYTIVIAAAKRARQLVDHAEPMIDNIKVDKPVSIAINELYAGKINVSQAVEEAEDNCEDEDIISDEEYSKEAEEYYSESEEENTAEE